MGVKSTAQGFCLGWGLLERGERMKNILKIWGSLAVSCLVALTVLNCSGSGTSTSSSSSSGSSSSTVQLATIDELPNSLAPVESSSSSSLSLAKGPLNALAETGQPLDSDPLGDGLIDGDTSMAGCQAFNMSKEAINQASMGALILCYVQNIFGGSDQTIDIYDGDFHIFGLDFSGLDEGGEGGGPDKVKFKIVKDDDGAITDFVMYACEEGEQNEYLLQSIDGDDFVQDEEGIHRGQYGVYNWGSSVTGTINSSGTFTDSKVIAIHFDSTWLSDGEEVGGGNGSITFTQAADSAELNGFMTGSNTFNGETFTFTDQFAGAMQLLDGNEADAENYDIGLLALGSGCVKGINSGDAVDCDACTLQNWEEEYHECWDGDDLLVEEDNAFADATAAMELPAISDQTAGFSGDQVYDCSGEVEQTLVLADLGVDFEAACADFQLGHEHIDCWQTIQSGGDSGDGENGQGGQDQGQQDQQQDVDISSFNISQCNGTPSGTAAFNQTTGPQLCACMEGIYGAGSIPCDEFSTICANVANVNACVTNLKAQ